jgi:hypothetical protein
MNPHASHKCAGRLLMVLAAITSILLISGCGSGSSSTPPPNQSGFGTNSLNGTYVISVSGTDVSTTTGTAEVVPFAIVGTIVANGTGGITGGTVDINDPGNTGVNIGQAVNASGSGYQINTDGRGTATVVTPVATVDFDLVLTSTSNGLISRFDDSGTDIGTGSGTIDLQSAATTLTGSYAFSLSGTDPSGNPLATVGAFTLTSTSIAGAQDFNDGNTSAGFLDLALSGSATLNTAGTLATALLTTPSSFGQLGFDAWVIDSTHLKFIETDGTGNVLSGDAFTQQTTFPSGQLVFTVTGQDASLDPIVAGGYATSTSSGALSGGVEDYNNGNTANTVPSFTASCTTFTAGRCQLATTGFTNGTASNLAFAAYPSSGGVLLLEDDSAGLAIGAAQAQSATSFTPSVGYGFNLSGVNNLNPNFTSGFGEVDDIAQFNAGTPDTSSTGAVNMTGSLDESDIGVTPTTSKLSGVYVPDTTADGRGSITATNNATLLGGFDLQYYVVDSSTVLFIDFDSAAADSGAAQVATGTFVAQSSSASAAVAHRAISMVRPLVRSRGAFQRK